MTGRTFVLGDIHGNLQALDQCLERCDFDNEKDKLIQLGDVCDRHPESAMVIERLLGISNLVAIRGNHDPWLEDWLKSGEIDPVWSKNGGIPTIESYISAKNKIDRSAHLSFLQNQVNYYIDNANRAFLHAGFTHPNGPEFEDPVSNCFWDRSLWRDAINGKINKIKPKPLEKFSEVFIGHTPTTKWQQDEPMQAFNLWNLDTGAGWKGKLTIMDVVTKEYWQSDTSDKLYIS